MPASAERVALVLDAGGARSAYQVGVLEVLLPVLEQAGERPRLVLGTSAGALIAAAMGGTAHLDAEEQASRLSAVLERATKRHVMRPLWRQTPVVAARYLSETLGVSGFRLRGLFGTGPLARTLATSIDWEALHANVASADLLAVTATAAAVRTGQVTVFAETAPALGDLPRPSVQARRRYAPTRLGVEHLMASSAIPVLFPSVHVEEPSEASGWYVDGATRRRLPIAPALELGADRVVVVGTGSLEPPEEGSDRDHDHVDLGDGGATLLGAVMDDPLRDDLRRLGGANELAADDELAGPLARHRAARGVPPYRVVPYAAVVPPSGTEIADLAMSVYRSNHGTLRRTMGDPDLQVVHRLLGSDSPLQGELLSYLMFDPDFFSGAADLGRRDARRWLADHPDVWRTSPLDVPT